MTRIIQNWMIIAYHEKIIQIWMITDGRIRTYLPQYTSCIPLHMPQYIDYSRVLMSMVRDELMFFTARQRFRSFVYPTMSCHLKLT